MTRELNDLMIDHSVNYQFVKRWFRRGDVQTLAGKFQLSKSTAYRSLKGKSKNYDFVKACYELALERANAFDKLNEKIKSA